MTRVALKGLASRPLRTFLTTLAIVLGVGMVSAAFTLTDTMRGAADSLSAAAYDGTDAVVTKRTAFTVDSDDYTIQRPTIAASALATVRSVPQVQSAVGDISDQAQIIGRNGKPSGDGPYFGSGFDSKAPGADKLTAFRLQTGRWATGDGEVVIDATTADKQRYAVGDRVKISTRGEASSFAVVGIARFGTVKSLGTATAAVFDLRTAQKLFDKQGRYDSILAAGKPGVPAADVRAAVRGKVGPGAQVQSAAKHDRFTLDGLKQFIGIIKTALLIFGGVAVLVGAFTIFNTLSITVAQRTREFAMLRMVGAARRQVLGSVLIEALALGARRVDHRHRRRLRDRRGAERRVRLPRPLAAVVRHGVRGPHRGRGAAGRHAGDAGRRLPPGAAGDEDRPRQRPARLRPDRPQAAAAVARRARRRVAGRPPGGRHRRLGRPARAPQRDAQPGPHRGHRERADDRRDARDGRHRRRQRPAAGDQGHARRADRGHARDRRPGRLVAGRPRDRAHRRVGPGRQGRQRAAPGRRARGRAEGGHQRGRPGDDRQGVRLPLEGRLEPGALLARDRRRGDRRGLRQGARPEGRRLGHRHLGEGRQAPADGARDRGLAGPRLARPRPGDGVERRVRHGVRDAAGPPRVRHDDRRGRAREGPGRSSPTRTCSPRTGSSTT